MTNFHDKTPPLRQWGIFQKIRETVKAGTCGELCSLRLSWIRPPNSDTNEHRFLYGTFGGLLDLAIEISGQKPQRLHIEKVGGKHQLFALLALEGEIVAEFEVNECAPLGMDPIHYIIADFTEGRVTNRPLVGHQNVEGALLVTSEGVERLEFRPALEALNEAPSAEIASLIARAIGRIV